MSDNDSKQASVGSGLFFLGLFIAIGLIASGWLISNTVYKARKADNIVTVKGLAERDVSSDLAIWQLAFNIPGGELNTTYQQAERQQDTVVSFLKAQGFSDQEVFPQPFGVQDLMSDAYNQARIREGGRYIIRGKVILRTNDAVKAAGAYGNAKELVAKGVVLAESMGPVYRFTGLNDIKPDMLKEATQKAREAAQQFADDSDSSVGAIKHAVQGFFSITGADSGVREDYNADQSLMKRVRVVTTVTYYLE